VTLLRFGPLVLLGVGYPGFMFWLFQYEPTLLLIYLFFAYLAATAAAVWWAM
jgi:hypothetical protein